MSDNKFPAALTRGFLLGPVIGAVLLFGALLAYLGAGLIGWNGRGQIIIALCAGPFVGLAILGLIWVVFKPKIGVGR